MKKKMVFIFMVIFWMMIQSVTTASSIYIGVFKSGDEIVFALNGTRVTREGIGRFANRMQQLNPDLSSQYQLHLSPHISLQETMDVLMWLHSKGLRNFHLIVFTENEEKPPQLLMSLREVPENERIFGLMEVSFDIE